MANGKQFKAMAGREEVLGRMEVAMHKGFALKARIVKSVDGS